MHCLHKYSDMVADTYFSIFFQQTQHYNCMRFLFPHHSPELNHCWIHWTLSDQKCFGMMISLHTTIMIKVITLLHSYINIVSTDIIRLNFITSSNTYSWTVSCRKDKYLMFNYVVMIAYVVDVSLIDSWADSQPYKHCHIENLLLVD